METFFKLAFANITIFAFIALMAFLAVPPTVQALNCTYHAYMQCNGNNLYWYDSCGAQQDLSQYCQNGCYNNSCQNYNNNNNNNNGSYHAYQRCSGNNLYWYDSNGNQQDLSQYCQNGCYNNTCQNYNNNNNYNNYNYNSCTYHAYRLCAGNNIYWYDSCDHQQDLYQACSGYNLVCQYGACVYKQPTPPPLQNTYVNHYRTACYNNDIYWYDSVGMKSGLYKSCSDTNSCTLDSCASSKCSHTVKCDGTTCSAGSADYNMYCATNTDNNNTTNNTTNNNTTNNNTNINVSPNGLSVSFFAKQDKNATQWQKTVQLYPNSQVYFLISVTNNSTASVDNANVSANIPTEVYSLGNLQINRVPVSGDIVSGVGVGSIAPSSSKLITFEGKTQEFTAQSTKQAIAIVSLPGGDQSDSVTINLNPAQQTAASVSSSAATNGFIEFLKRWYLWILVGIVLIFLFIVVFRRLSSNQ